MPIKQPTARTVSQFAAAPPVQAAQAEAPRQHGHDNFLRVMLFGPSDLPASPDVADIHLHAVPPPAAARHFHALPQSRLNPAAGYHLPASLAREPVDAGSPALQVMTDLRRIEAVTIRGAATIDDANGTMIRRGVRALLVTGDQDRVLGIVTSRDVLGEKPMQITHQRGLRHDEVLVRDIMTPADRLEVIDLRDVLTARVGDVIDTLKHAGRQHALVVEHSGDAQDHRQTVRGIFSLTQIARQLGIRLQIPEIGHTFAEIEAAIGH